MGCRCRRRGPLFAQACLAMLSPLFLGASLHAQDKKDPSKDEKPKVEKSSAKTGLHLNDPRAFKGYTLFSPLNSAKVFLIDMEGKVAHTWEGDTRPGCSVYLLPNGNLLRPCEYTEKKTTFGLGGGNAGRVQEFTW